MDFGTTLSYIEGAKESVQKYYDTLKAILKNHN